MDKNKLEDALDALVILAEIGLIYLRAIRRAGATLQESDILATAYIRAMLLPDPRKRKDGAAE